MRYLALIVIMAATPCVAEGLAGKFNQVLKKTEIVFDNVISKTAHETDSVNRSRGTEAESANENKFPLDNKSTVSTLRFNATEDVSSNDIIHNATVGERTPDSDVRNRTEAEVKSIQYIPESEQNTGNAEAVSSSLDSLDKPNLAQCDNTEILWKNGAATNLRSAEEICNLIFKDLQVMITNSTLEECIQQLRDTKAIEAGVGAVELVCAGHGEAVFSFWDNQWVYAVLQSSSGRFLMPSLEVEYQKLIIWRWAEALGSSWRLGRAYLVGGRLAWLWSSRQGPPNTPPALTRMRTDRTAHGFTATFSLGSSAKWCLYAGRVNCIDENSTSYDQQFCFDTVSRGQEIEVGGLPASATCRVQLSPLSAPAAEAKSRLTGTIAFRTAKLEKDIGGDVFRNVSVVARCERHGGGGRRVHVIATWPPAPPTRAPPSYTVHLYTPDGLVANTTLPSVSHRVSLRNVSDAVKAVKIFANYPGNTKMFLRKVDLTRKCRDQRLEDHPRLGAVLVAEVSSAWVWVGSALGLAGVAVTFLVACLLTRTCYRRHASYKNDLIVTEPFLANYAREEALRRALQLEGDGEIEVDEIPKEGEGEVVELEAEVGGVVAVTLGCVLGGGNFGLVRLATLPSGDTAAIKMPRGSHNEEIAREVEVLRVVAGGPHVVRVLGYRAPASPARPAALLLEHCALGDLLSYLRKHQPVLADQHLDACSFQTAGDAQAFVAPQVPAAPQGPAAPQAPGATQVHGTPKDANYLNLPRFTEADLLSFCRQVAAGMAWVAGLRVVHRDLAARNVLVHADRTLRVADFGLARDLYETSVYLPRRAAPLPLKWMAPESILHNTYTTHSDVFSFGVLMWEVWSVGGEVWGGQGSVAAAARVLAGERPTPPKRAPAPVRALLHACWERAPARRPAFPELHRRLDVLLDRAVAAASRPYLALQETVTKNP